MLDPLWFHVPKPCPRAPLRLYCFPHAGGGAAAFRGWPELLGDAAEVVAVRLPGRENRFAERRYRRMADVVAALVRALDSGLGRPFAFFGHSLGALVAFETACALAAAGKPQPAHLIVAASSAPGRSRASPPLHALPTDALLTERLREFGGMPDEVLAQGPLLSLLLPTVRDDFEIGETYRHTAAEPLYQPVTALGGTRDRTVSEEELRAWRDVTAGPFGVRMLPGGHFFVREAPLLTAACVVDALAAGPAAGRPGPRS